MRTQAGWLEKNEVVEVYYDPDRTSLEKLIEQAKGIRKFSKAWIDSEIDLLAAKKLIEDKAVQTAGQIRRAKDSDQLYYLRRSLIWWLPLTNQQAIRANSLLARKEDATDVLSAAQNKLLTTIKARFPKKGQGLVLLQDLRPCRDPVQFVSYELALLEVLEKSQKDR